MRWLRKIPARAKKAFTTNRIIKWWKAKRMEKEIREILKFVIVVYKKDPETGESRIFQVNKDRLLEQSERLNDILTEYLKIKSLDDPDFMGGNQDRSNLVIIISMLTLLDPNFDLL
ncbi:hypothetical protein ACFLZS_00600 [Patescibacteria group bacterium]